MLRLMVCLALFMSFIRGYGTEAVGEGPGINETGVDAVATCCCLWVDRSHSRAMALWLYCSSTHKHSTFELEIGHGEEGQAPPKFSNTNSSKTTIDRIGIEIACGDDADMYEFDITCSVTDGSRGRYPLFITEARTGKKIRLTHIYVFDSDKERNQKLQRAESRIQGRPNEFWPYNVKGGVHTGTQETMPWLGDPTMKAWRERLIWDHHDTQVSVWYLPNAHFATLVQSDVPDCGWSGCRHSHQCECKTCVKVLAEKGKIHECVFRDGLNQWGLLKDVVGGKERFCHCDTLNQAVYMSGGLFQYIRYRYDFRDNVLDYRLYGARVMKIYPPGEDAPTNDQETHDENDADSVPSTQIRYQGPPLPVDKEIMPEPPLP